MNQPDLIVSAKETIRVTLSGQDLADRITHLESRGIKPEILRREKANAEWTLQYRRPTVVVWLRRPNVTEVAPIDPAVGF